MLNKANFAERDCHLGQDKNQDDLAFALAQGYLMASLRAFELRLHFP